MAKFDPAAFAAERGRFQFACRLIDGREMEFEFEILTGERALQVKREIFELEKETRKIIKDEKGKELDERDTDAAAGLAEIDQRTLRVLCRHSLGLPAEYKDETLDRLIVSAGGINSRFAEAVFHACGISHPKDLVKLMKPDLFADLPFLSQEKRAKTTEE